MGGCLSPLFHYMSICSGTCPQLLSRTWLGQAQSHRCSSRGCQTLRDCRLVSVSPTVWTAWAVYWCYMSASINGRPGAPGTLRWLIIWLHVPVTDNVSVLMRLRNRNRTLMLSRPYYHILSIPMRLGNRSRTLSGITAALIMYRVRLLNWFHWNLLSDT